MKALFFVLFFYPLLSFGQLISGTAVSEGRKLITKTDFKLKSTMEGVIYYEVAINRKGKITSTTFKPTNSTVKSTPLKIEAVNFLKGLEFDANDLYPEFHHALIAISFVNN